MEMPKWVFETVVATVAGLIVAFVTALAYLLYKLSGYSESQAALFLGFGFLWAILAVAMLRFANRVAARQWAKKKWDTPPYNDELAEKVATLEQAQRSDAARIREYRWRVNWDMLPPSTTNATPTEIAYVRTEIARCETELKALADALGGSSMGERGLIDEIVHGLYQQDPRGSAHQLAPLFLAQVAGPTVRLLSLLRSPGDEDPRAVFRAFFDQYRKFREWPAKAARYQDRRLTTFAWYEKWEAADAGFFERLGNIPNEGRCKEIRAYVQESKREGYPGLLFDVEDERVWQERQKRELEEAAKTILQIQESFQQLAAARKTVLEPQVSRSEGRSV